MNLNRLVFTVALMLALSAGPSQAQTYAPAPRALTPVAPVPGDVCAPAPQGQGSTSPQCRQECSRNPKYSSHCPQPGAAPVPAPNWGAPPVAGPAPAIGGASQAPGTPAQFGDSLRPGQPAARPDAMKEVRPSLPAVQNANAGAGKQDRPRSSALPAPAATPVKTRSGVDACQNAADVDGCRKQCAESLASSPMCPPPTTFDYCSVSPASAVCQQFCQQMNGQYSLACPNAPKPQQAASQGAPAASSAATAADICAPAPQGKGTGSAECKHACDRNPNYSAYCTRVGTTPPAAGGPVAGGAAPPSGGAASPAVRGPTMAMAPALAPQASSTLPGSQPPSRTGTAGAAANVPISCAKAQAVADVDPYIGSVDGRSSQTVFTPGKAYTIKGCGFGDRKRSVALNGSGGGMSNLVLIVSNWSNDTITVQVDPKLGGVLDQSGVEVVVLRNDGRRLQQGGHTFAAARDVIKLASLPQNLVVGQGPWSPRKMQFTSPAATGATFAVRYYTLPGRPVCPNAKDFDVLPLASVLKSGFAVDRVVARDLTLKNWKQGEHGDDGRSEWHRQTPFSYQVNGNDIHVVPGWFGHYIRAELAISGMQSCWAEYEMDVFVKGPRGFSPL